MTCSICHEDHLPVKFEIGGVKVFAECPTILTIVMAGTDGAMGFKEAEALYPRGIPLQGGEIVRKVRWWVLGAGAFGTVIGFTVGTVL